MKIVLIGMSGIGKTYWSKRLERELSYHRVGCDDLINASLSKKLAAYGVKPDFRSLSAWRGQPFEAGFREKQAMQIETEQEVMEVVAQRLATSTAENVVVDTGGSVIYAHADTLSAIKTHSTVVYFQATIAQKEALYTDEIIFRRPLIWGDQFTQLSGETGEEAMRRSFGDVLAWRFDEYEKLADVCLSVESVRKCRSARDFLDVLNSSLDSR